MIESILLDILLVLVVILMAAIGAYRGGLREAFSAAGVVLGVLLATEWAGAWGRWLDENSSLSEGGGRFLVSAALLVLATALVGYGVGASFNYHPGPGGRMFGAVLGGASALVAISYVLTWLRADLFEGEEPGAIGSTLLASFLNGGAGTVLLVVSIGIVFGAIFGSIVRERDDDVHEISPAPSFAPRRITSRSAQNVPDKVEPPERPRQPSAPVRVQQSRQWDDRAAGMPPAVDRQWANTWPSDAPGIPAEERPSRPSDVQQARERRRSQQRDSSEGAGGRPGTR